MKASAPCSPFNISAMTVKDKPHIWFFIYLVCIGAIAALIILLKGDAIQEWLFPHHFSYSMSLMGQVVAMAMVVLVVELAVAFGLKLKK